MDTYPLCLLSNSARPASTSRDGVARRNGASTGRPGRKAGEFFHLHSLDVDPQGNIVTGESQGYRVQKFIYKGPATTAR
jgi:hypothetical protein